MKMHPAETPETWKSPKLRCHILKAFIEVTATSWMGMLVFSALADVQTKNPPRTTLFHTAIMFNRKFQRLSNEHSTHKTAKSCSQCGWYGNRLSTAQIATAHLAECPCITNILGDTLNAQLNFSYLNINIYFAQIR